MRHYVVWIFLFVMLTVSGVTALAQDDTETPFPQELETITVENATQVRELAVAEISVNHDSEILWSPNSETVFVDGVGGVRFYALNSNDIALQTLGEPDNPAYSLAFSPDGQMIAFSTGNEIGHGDIHLRGAPMGEDWGTLIGFGPVAFSPDGTLLAFNSRENKLYPRWNRYLNLWDINADEEFASLIVSDFAGAYAYQIVFSPTGAVLAFAIGVDLYLWNIETEVITDIMEPHPNGVQDVAFSPDGSLLISVSSASNVVWVWDVETGEQRARIRAHRDSVLDMALSPDGNLLATGGWYGEDVQLWGVNQISGVVDESLAFASLAGHECCAVQSLAFSPDGAILASGGSYEDGTVRLWNVDARTQISVLEGHYDAVRDVLFSPNGQLLASIGDDNKLRLWGIPAT